MPKFSKPKNCVVCEYRSKYLTMLNDKDVKLMQENCLIVSFRKGENVCKQGSVVTHALYLSKGRVKLTLESTKKDIILKLINEGEYLGLHSIFENKIYNFSITTLENSDICMIDANFFQKLAQKNSKFLFEITKTLGASANFALKKIIDFNQKNVQGRITDMLLHFSDEVYKSKEFNISITRKELSELTSMSMENAVRQLSELNKDGIIKLEGKKITILQYDLLKKISEMS